VAPAERLSCKLPFASLHMMGSNDPLMDVADSSQLMECFQEHGRWARAQCFWDTLHHGACSTQLGVGTRSRSQREAHTAGYNGVFAMRLGCFVHAGCGRQLAADGVPPGAWQAG
jgi:hypothetical protein